jgi:hypothetical protein
MQLVACDSPIGRLGVTICYDLRFPEVYQALTFNHGAQILLMPSAFTKLTGKFPAQPFEQGGIGQESVDSVGLQVCSRKLNVNGSNGHTHTHNTHHFDLITFFQFSLI